MFYKYAGIDTIKFLLVVIFIAVHCLQTILMLITIWNYYNIIFDDLFIFSSSSHLHQLIDAIKHFKFIRIWLYVLLEVNVIYISYFLDDFILISQFPYFYIIQPITHFPWLYDNRSVFYYGYVTFNQGRVGFYWVA